MDSRSVISQAAKGIVEKLADDREISTTRMYEILGKDNPYPKAKKLIRDIARNNPNGARLIKADMDALWIDILEPVVEPSLEELHKEAFEAVQAVLANKPRDVKAAELRELIAIASSMLENTEKTELRAVNG